MAPDSGAPTGASWRYQRWVACGLPVAEAAAGAPADTGPAAEVARLGCVQAQEFDMTLWSLSQRTGASRADVLAAVSGGEVVRTHAMRPTWHFVHRVDLAKVQVATAERVHPIMRPMLRSRDLDDAALERWGQWLADTLRDGALTRRQLQARLEGSPFVLDGLALGFALMWAELELIIASGPPVGGTHTYQLLDPDLPRPDRADAVRWVVERILSSHGPTSVADVCAWSSLTVSDVRAALAELGDAVSSAELLGDQRYWIGRLDDSAWPEAPTVTLINGYDEYVSGLQVRSKMHLDPQRLYRERRGAPVATVMSDGRLVGQWRRTTTRTDVRVEVVTLRALSPAERTALEGCATRYGVFCGLPVNLTVAEA